MNCRYWCSYWPEDKRNAPPPPKRKRNAIKKRGCQCHLLVKVYENNPNVTFIEFTHFKHVDLNGVPCHGVHDPTKDESYLVAPLLSSEVVLMIEGLLAIGVSINTITNGTYLNEVFGELPSIRDNFILRKDVYNICNTLQKMDVRKHDEDPESVKSWYEVEKENYFIYHPHVDNL